MVLLHQEMLFNRVRRKLLLQEARRVARTFCVFRFTCELLRVWWDFRLLAEVHGGTAAYRWLSLGNKARVLSIG